jgi:hypothetical protein
VPHLTSPKGSFWWRDILKLVDKFRELAVCLPGSGASISLWLDTFDDLPFSEKFPILYSHTLDENVPLQKALLQADLLSLFRLPMSRLAYNEFMLFRDKLDDFRTDMQEPDVWVVKCRSGLYTSTLYYQHQFKDVNPPPIFSWIWKAKCMPKIKVFSWLLLVDRLNTRGMLLKRNKHLEEGYLCVL